MNSTILESDEWRELAARGESIGPEALLEEILDRRAWSNAEILWVIKRLIFFYALHDEILQKLPVTRLCDNFTALLRGVYMIIDQANPDLDDNIRAYACTKLNESTWGISRGTRSYLKRNINHLDGN